MKKVIKNIVHGANGFRKALEDLEADLRLTDLEINRHRSALQHTLSPHLSKALIEHVMNLSEKIFKVGVQRDVLVQMIEQKKVEMLQKVKRGK